MKAPEPDVRAMQSICNLVTKAESLRAKQRNRELAQQATKVAPSPVIQMRLFPAEDMRAIPNYLARTPLFAPIRPGPRAKRTNELLASAAGFEIRYTGDQLDQADCDVFMQLVHEASGKPLGETAPIAIVKSKFLAQIGRDDGYAQYKWLKSVFRRLGDAQIDVQSDRYDLTTRLVLKKLEDKQEGIFALLLDCEIIKMFAANEYSLVDWEKRKQLERRIDLAKWLLNFTCSHEKGLQHHSLLSLKEWSGYSSPMRKFREATLHPRRRPRRLPLDQGR